MTSPRYSSEKPVSSGAAARLDPLHQHLGGRLQVHHEVGLRHALREQREELVEDEQLRVVEVEVGEEPALLEDVVGERRLGEQLPLRQLLLLPVAREQEEELGLEGDARLAVVEGAEEGFVAQSSSTLLASSRSASLSTTVVFPAPMGPSIAM